MWATPAWTAQGLMVAGTWEELIKNCTPLYWKRGEEIMHVKTCFMAGMLLYLSTISKLLKHIRRFLRCEGTLLKSWYFDVLTSRQATTRSPGWSVIPRIFHVSLLKASLLGVLRVPVCVCSSMKAAEGWGGLREVPMLDTACKVNKSQKHVKRPHQRIIQKHKLENEHFSHIRSLFPSSKTEIHPSCHIREHPEKHARSNKWE